MIYGAMLLFQYRVVRNGESTKRTICEERIFHINSDDSESAYKMATRKGKDEERQYTENDEIVFYEFVGIIELVDLGSAIEDDEVWYRFVEKISPMERKDKIIPPKNKLNVFRSNKGKMVLHKK